MCHKCHVSYSNANLGTASSLLERSAELQLIFDKDSIFFGKIQRILREKSLEGRISLLLQFFHLAFPQRLQFLLLRCQEIFGISKNVIFSSFIVSIILKVTSNGNARFCKSRFIANAIPHSTFLGVQILTKLTSHVSMQIICKRIRDASIYTSKKYRSSFYS